MSNCHNWWNRKNWYYPVKGWKIRICKVCGQTQTIDREGYTNSTIDEYLKMIKWATERDKMWKSSKSEGLLWLKKNGVIHN